MIALLSLSPGNRTVPPLPLLLHKILFSPAATWLCRSLQLSGVRRFFVVTEPAYLTDSAACFPPDAIVLPFDHPQLNLRLAAFAAGARDQVITITRPVWLSFAAAAELAGQDFLFPPNGSAGLYRVDPSLLVQNGLDAALRGECYAPPLGPDPILLPLTSRADLAARSPAPGWTISAAGCPWASRPWT